MGGKSSNGGKGGQVQIPQFVLDSQKEIAQVSQGRFDRQFPLVETGASQLTELLSTGGVGARVPIVENAVRSQEKALAGAQEAIGGNLARGGVTGPVAERINTGVAREGSSRIRNVGPDIAGPAASANIVNAIGAGEGASAGFQAGLNALARGKRRNTGNPADLIGAGANIARLFAGIQGGKSSSGFNTFQGGGTPGPGFEFSDLTPTGGFGPGIGFE